MSREDMWREKHHGLPIRASRPARATGVLLTLAIVSCEESCSPSESPYEATGAARIFEGAEFGALPGFTRSVYKRDHALVAPESRVYAPLGGWFNASAAYVVTPSMGSHFSMALVTMQPGSLAGPPAVGVERFVFVLSGGLLAWHASGEEGTRKVDLKAGGFVYFPAYQPPYQSGMKAAGCGAASLIVFERTYIDATGSAGRPYFLSGATDALPPILSPGEVFELRKLLPSTPEFDFNVHVMDFHPGQYLNVKEMHYNQHGMMLLQGCGIQRLGDSWYTVKAGDVIWMAPFVPQWYAALGETRTRYILYKDTARDPLLVLPQS